MILLLALIGFVVYAYLWRHNNFPKLQGLYSQQVDAWYFVRLPAIFLLKTIHRTANRIRRRKKREEEIEFHRISHVQEKNQISAVSFVNSDTDGNITSIRFCRHQGQIAEVGVVIRLADGTILSRRLKPECLTTDETPTGDETEEGYISSSGLRIRAIDPMRKYRILYSGLMQVHSKDESAVTYTHVNLRFWFRALTDAANFGIDHNPWTVAKFVALEPDWVACLRSFAHPKATHTQQSGELRGILDVFGKRQELSLNGVKDHINGEPILATLNGFFVLRVRFESGLVFSLHLSSVKDKITHKLGGFAFFMSGYAYPIEWTDLHLSQFSPKGGIPNKLAFSLRAHGRVYEMRVEVLSSTTETIPDGISESSLLVVHESLVKVLMTGENVSKENVGFGTIEFNNRGERVDLEKPLEHPKILLHSLSKPDVPSDIPQCIQLHDPLCRISSITGGKAAKLADIVAVVSTLKDSEIHFKVPDGFAITAAAYENHLKSAPHLAEHIKKVLKIAYSMNECKDDAGKLASLTAQLEAACKELHDAFAETSLTQSLQDEIQQHMETTFGQTQWKSAFTAVRSSAVGEDGSDASGAGQMETFLGKRGLGQICEAVKLCWASHYAFRAIQYRRQMCCILNAPMAVLVQDLVNADVAGVLFTRHPDSGSVSQSVINACYGIGEGVVSGHVQPDTISVYKDDPNSEDVRIAYDVLGEKATSYKLDEEKGLVEEGEIATVQVDQSGNCCLNEEEIRCLYRVGMLLEQTFGSGRDVEFALKKESTAGSPSIFILQARPITTADMEDEWELLHELDTPIASNNEWITTANVQEMMPGALTPLSGAVWMEAIADALDRGQYEMGVKANQRFRMWKNAQMYYQHVFMNWTLIGAGLTREFNKAAGDLAIFGREIKETKIESFIEQNDMSGILADIQFQLMDYRERFMPFHGIDKYIAPVESLQLPATTNPAILFQQIRQLMPFMQKVWGAHLTECSPAIMWPVAIMHIIDSSMKWGPEMYSDMAVMLSTCTDVFSADVPTLLQGIAKSISSDEKALKYFMDADRRKAAEWLLSQESGQHGLLFKKFLAKHGHRCVRDSDIREKSWNQEPEKLIDALKVMISTGAKQVANQKKELSVEEALDSIKAPLTKFQRLLIKFILPKARTAVGRREWAKSYGIKVTNHYRRCVYRLATLLCEQGSLPDVDLIFFLLPDEIDRLVVKHSPKLIAKALRRRKLFPKFSGIQFPELFQGHGEPMKADDATTVVASGDQFSIKGTAVGQGCINGTARVVKSLAEANKIQAGDILIVSYTDVGWTPYFPMISGLVTELGGLISHGAVVAREYGLPCLVGCKRATELVKTGDTVYIDGHSGEIRVTPKKDRENESHIN